MSTTADQRVTTNTYNALGRLESVTTPEGTIHYEYDYLGRHTRTYTGAKDTTGVSTPSDGIAVTDTHYAYDSLGRLDTVTTVERFDTPLTTPETTDYIYDLLGNLDETHSPNGVIADYQYDNLNRLELLRHFRDTNDDDQYTAGVDALLSEYDYTLQSDGRRTGVTETDHQGNTTRIDWTYDNAGRLTRESYNSHDNSLDFITDYIFDLVGNRLSKKTDTNPTFLGDPTFDETVTNTHDANDRLLTETKDAPGTTEDRHTEYTYNNTQQTQKTTHAGLDNTAPIASQTDYAYNLQGRMATVELDTDGNGLSDTRLDYEYNDHGIRISQEKRVDTDADGDFTDETPEQTDYLVDERNPTGYAQILEEWLNGQLKTSYTLAHDVLTQAAITGAIHHLLYDGHGSTRMLVDALGLPLSSEIYAYDAYGNPIGFDPQEALTTLLYSGEQTDAATGFQYLRARYYDPSTGTFNRLDPFFGNLEDPQSLHKYLYTHGDPIQGIDPTGLEFSLSGLVSATAIGAGVGALSGAAIGGAHGAVKGGLSGALAGAANGFLWGLVAGGSIAAGGYALGSYFVATSTLSVVQCYGGATLVAAIPWRIAASFSLAHAIKSGDPVDIAFASLGFILGYLPVTEGTQFNTFIGAYFRSLPFVKNFKLITPKTANKGTGGGGWEVAYAAWRWAGEFVTAKPIRFIRLFKTGRSRDAGGWVTAETEVIGLTPKQIQQRLALDFVPDAYQVVDVPPGVSMKVGQVGPQTQFKNVPPANGNGGLQFQFSEHAPFSWFSKPKPIDSKFQKVN